MTRGYFSSEFNLPFIEVAIVFGGKSVSVNCILDTGFSGDLKIDRQTAAELDIDEMGPNHYAINANGERVATIVKRGYAELENKRAPVSIMVVDGASLAGIGLLSVFGYKAVVDCKEKLVYLEN